METKAKWKLLKTQKVVRQEVRGENGTLRSSVQRVHFPFEECGTTFRLAKKGQTVFLERTVSDREDDKTLKVQRASCGKDNDLYYLRTYPMHLPKHVTYLNVFRNTETGDYRLEPATESEVKTNAHKYNGTHPTGTITATGYLSLSAYADFLWTKGALEMEICIDGTRSFIRLTPVEHTDLPVGRELQTLHGVQYAKKLKHYKVRLAKVHYDHKNVIVPRAFLSHNGLKHLDILPVWLEKETESLVIEGKPGTCDLCGTEISRFHEEGKELLVRPEVKDRIRIIGEEIRKDPYTEVKEQIQVLKERIRQTCETMERLAKEASDAIKEWRNEE